MTEQELQEIIALLGVQGWNPQVCDTPVPVYDSAVPCGKPSDVESAYPDGAFWLPGDLVQRESVVIISAVGDSMVDAGIEDGDQLHLQLDASIRDGDQVVVCINGESTLKSYFRDSDGTVWLVACNENYDAIEVTEDMEVRILGKVVKCVKNTPSSSFRYLQRAVNRTKTRRIEGGRREEKSYTDDELRCILRRVLGTEMVAAADWVSVYRLLVDKCGAPSSHTAFAEFVNALELDEYPPCSRDLLRKADAIYLRPIYEWGTANIRSSAHDRRTAIARRLKKALE